MRYGASAYRYSDGGELRLRTSGNDTTRFTYDPLGNLVRVKTGDGHQIDYVIDGMNRRVGYKVDGLLQRVWLYRNGLSPEAELDRQGYLVTRFVHGTQGHAPDLLFNGNHAYRVVTDYLGSVRAVVDTGDGTVAQRIDYDAWGARIADTAPGFQRLGFAGGLTDSATGLVKFGARDYDPMTGRWTAKEPLVLRLGHVARYLPDGGLVDVVAQVPLAQAATSWRDRGGTQTRPSYGKLRS
jgi:RHS repeat-associated protein